MGLPNSPLAIPGGLVFYDLLLTSPVSPLQLRASQRASFAFSIANVSALEADEETPGPGRGEKQYSQGPLGEDSSAGLAVVSHS